MGTGTPTRNLNHYIQQGLWNGNKGKKTVCPVCGHTTFALKSPDTVAKCFHGSCGFSAIAGFSDRPGFYRDFFELMDRFFDETHKELLSLKDQNYDHAYRYLIHREIHQEVISLSDLGVFDYSKHFVWMNEGFENIIQKAKENLQKNDTEQIRKEIEFNEKAKKLFSKVFHSGVSGHIIFFNRGKEGNIKSAKIRKPFGDSKTCRLFKPFETVNGLFNHTLFSPDKKETDKKIILFEGEFNSLQFQSLVKRVGLNFINSASWGGVQNINTEELIKTEWEPIICYDNDEPGKKIISILQSEMTLEVFTTPTQGSDMDSFICSISDPKEAWNQIKDLIKNRVKIDYNPDNNGKRKSSYSKLRVNWQEIADNLCKKYHPFAISTKADSFGTLYLYKEGHYTDETGFLRQEIQSLLGNRVSSFYISEIIKYMGGNLVIPPDSIDLKATELINLENCMLNWRTGEKLEHHPKYLSTIRIPNKFDPKAECPNIDRFLETTFDPEVIPLIEELAGYCLIPELWTQCFVIMYGLGGNGKTRLMDIISHLVGKKNRVALSLKQIEENRFAPARLYRKLICTGNEVTGYIQDSDIIKRLTGEDELSAETKYNDPFEFENKAKMFFTSNDLPTFSAKDYGLYRRLILIPFTKTFKGEDRDPNLKQKITTFEELSGFLNRALSGLYRMKIEKKSEFTLPPQVEKALNEFQSKNDNLRFFIDTECEITGLSGDFVATTFFFQEYLKFCKDNGMGKPCQMNRLKERMESIDERIKHDRQRTGNNRVSGFSGIRILKI